MSATTPKKTATTEASATTTTGKSAAKANVGPKVTTTPAKSKRPAKSDQRDYGQGEVVLAHHPRLHPEMGTAIVQENFTSGAQTHVRIKFEGSDDLVLNHWHNVFAG